MKKSFYFAELQHAYEAELHDLTTDSQGEEVLARRLKEKRQALAAILPMLEFSPEMVLPVFLDAFEFIEPAQIQAALHCEPDDADFPDWSVFSACVSVDREIQSLIDLILEEPSGNHFMVAAVCVEFLRQRQSADPLPERSHDENEDPDAEEEGDLAERGDDWLAEQGFDSFKS